MVRTWENGDWRGASIEAALDDFDIIESIFELVNFVNQNCTTKMGGSNNISVSKTVESDNIPTHNDIVPIHITRVEYNDKVTVLWHDDVKAPAVVKCDENDPYNKEIGFTLAYLKATLGDELFYTLLHDYYKQKKIWINTNFTSKDRGKRANDADTTNS